MNSFTSLTFLSLAISLQLLGTFAANDSEALFLTPLIRNGELEKARSVAADNMNLTNIQTKNPINSFSGYFTIEEKSNSNLFFWFFPAQETPETAPLVLWVNELPGISCLRGVFLENGPFSFNATGGLQEREYSWAKGHSMLYIDAPIGTGYSFADSDDTYAKNLEDEASEVYEALLQFFTLFPSFQARDLYLAGKSYAGAFIPAIATKIDSENENSNTTKISMKGFIIGSPWIDTITQSYSSEYMYYIGLIDGKQAEEINELETAFEDAIKANATEDAGRISNILYAGPSALYPKYTGYQNFQSALQTTESQEVYRFQEFLDSDEMHKLLHVGLRKFNGISIKTAEKFAGNFFTLNSTGLVENLLEKGYRVLLYSPQFDLFNSHLGIKAVLSNLKWKGSEEFGGAKRTFWTVKEEIAGYVTTGGNLTFVLVRNAGNNALQDQPEWTYAMVEKFLQGKQF